MKPQPGKAKIHLNLSKALYQSVSRFAKEEGESIATISRLALKAYVEANRKKETN